MDYSRYQSGGDIYNTIATRYGTAGADRVAAAALSQDPVTINQAYTLVKYGPPASESTLGIFADQIFSDPLAAPLESANRQIGLAAWNFLKNPWVLAALAVGVWVWLGMPGLKKR